MKKFEYFDVTADIGFYAFGKNLNEAFENAGLAMFNIISNTDNIDKIKSIDFEITSEDNVSLLYDYLEELLFYHEVEFMLFSEFSVQISQVDDAYYLKAIIKGEDINWDKHERNCEIKAITFHQMEVDISDVVSLKAIVDL
ncbi:archease [uncultured Methanobrevibacter sp.]|uniref:archease n=1 Tax=uncultured Methanobrevibacter sp. TaxID=253161 RepID=UPI0025EB3EE9|nr:archease [uncultured Methanobrevibacter sp.]